MNRLRVLFVCHANVCRSPLAHGILFDLIRKRGCEDLFEVDSAGTWAEEGIPPHPHSVAVAAAHGIDLGVAGSSRGLVPADLCGRGEILAMDRANLADLERLRGLARPEGDPGAAPRIRLLKNVVDPSLWPREAEVEDPVGRGVAAYEQTYRTLQRGCVALLDELLCRDPPT